MHTDDRSWISLRQDADTGIETIRAHFEGHAYDPHWHDSYLIGFTEQGVQQFSCRGVLHQSTPGRIFLLEPGEIHDGDAPAQGGFTYSMLYLEPTWFERELRTLDDTPLVRGEPGFATTLTQRPQLLGMPEQGGSSAAEASSEEDAAAKTDRRFSSLIDSQ